MKKKVAFFVVGLNAGGIENYLLRFLIHYRNEIEATVYCKSGWVGDLENDFRKEDILVKTFKVGYFNPFDLIKLKDELLSNSFEAIIDFTGNFAALPFLVGRSIGIGKRICWYRNADDKFKKTKLRVFYNNLLNRATNKLATDILSNSKTALKYFYKDYNWENDKRFEVIYNGLDSIRFLATNENLREELSIPNNAFVVGNIGRLNEQKNHKTAIEVAIQLCLQFDDIYFIFCGKGVKEAYGNVVNEKMLSDRIIFTGVRRDIIKVLNSMNCFYFPSILEGQPNALIEAMVAGIPFVASDIEPVKETTPASLHSYLVPPLDIEKAKEGILKIRSNNDYKQKFIVNKWAIDNFNSSKQFKKFFDKI